MWYRITNIIEPEPAHLAMTFDSSSTNASSSCGHYTQSTQSLLHLPKWWDSFSLSHLLSPASELGIQDCVSTFQARLWCHCKGVHLSPLLYDTPSLILRFETPAILIDPPIHPCNGFERWTVGLLHALLPMAVDWCSTAEAVDRI